jgi:hypothetical protein
MVPAGQPGIKSGLAKNSQHYQWFSSLHAKAVKRAYISFIPKLDAKRRFRAAASVWPFANIREKPC